jgi:hypothetical protein
LGRPFVVEKPVQKKTIIPSGHKRGRRILYVTGILLLLLIAGYFIANAVIRNKVDQALRALPPSLHVNYRSLTADVLAGSLEIQGLEARYEPAAAPGHSLVADRIAIRGISFLKWLTAHSLRIRAIRAEGVTVDLDAELLEKDSSMKDMHSPAADALIGQLEVGGLTVIEKGKGKQRLTIHGDLRLDSVTSGAFGAVHFVAADAAYTIPGMDETVRLDHLELDSKKRFLHIDTLKISPDRDKIEIGRSKGHQVDVIRASVMGIETEDLDVMGLAYRRLIAGQIGFKGSRIYVFRDRRLPLDTGDKPTPIASLEGLPIDMRVGKFIMGMTRFEYEEYPKEGQKTGLLMIERLHGTMEPLLNRPGKGDPAFLTLWTEGSLMGSGSVTATTRMPLHANASYEVEGAFHQLDVTTLNDPAENLGQLHLESGMLNSLVFQFEMGPERSTGKIVGEYHDLVVDKMKEKGGQLKKDKFKSFALKKFIIPKDKDKSLPVSKRTGKVDYKRDKERYFSYYLLHSLLVGVKSSFSLGFLLPG